MIVIMLFFTVTSPVFLTYNNVIAILRQVTVLGVAAVGMTFVRISGGVDLSIGAMISISGVMIGILNTRYGVNIFVCMLLAVLLCACVGAVNGFIVAKARLIALIVTMATRQVMEGISYTVSNGMPIGNINPAIRFFGQGTIGPIQVPVLILFLSILVGHFILNYTYLGRHIYASGGNEDAARLSGIHTDRIKILCFILCGVFAGISALIMLGRVNTALPTTGLGDENMNIMTATMLGGASLSGGGSVMGTMAGILIIGVLNNGLLLLGANEYVQTAVKGVVLLIAICFDPVQQYIAKRLRTRKYVKEHNL